MNKGYLSLWLLLLAAFSLMAASECLDGFSIAGHRFQTSTLIAELSRPHENIADTIPTDTITPADTIRSRFPVPVDTASKTILFIGDSMLEGLSPRLAAYCQTNGHRLYSVIWYSSTTEVWGRCDTLSTFISRYDPDYVMVCLGANELFVRDIEKKRTPMVTHMLGEIGERPLLWIGPPNWKDDTGINALLQSMLPEGTFFLSDGMTFDRKKDGAHPTSASAALWMDSIVRWMPAHCAHPIRMEMPEQLHGRANRTILLQPLQ